MQTIPGHFYLEARYTQVIEGFENVVIDYSEGSQDSVSHKA